MKSVFGLLVALAGLFIVWLWASGRANAVWQSLVSGNASTGAASTTNPSAPSASPLQVNFDPNAQIPNLIQLTPFQLPSEPNYIPTIGSNVFNIPTEQPNQLLQVSVP